MRSSTKTVIPSLLGTKLLDAVKEEVKGTARRYFAMTNPELTEDEFIQAFIEPEHVPVLKQASALCGGIDTSSSVNIPLTDNPELRTKNTVDLKFNGKSPLPFPAYMAEQGLIERCPTHLRDRLLGWYRDRISEGDLLGDLIDTLTVYDRVLRDVRSFAIMLPCLPILLRMVNSDQSKRMIHKAMTGTKFELPRLPEQVATRVQEVSSFMTGLSMLTIRNTHHAADAIWLERSTWSESGISRPHIMRKVYPAQCGFTGTKL